MPHQCTGCGQTFPDGSTEMLSGCPQCGGNKFQYFPGEAPDNPPDDEPPEPLDPGMSGTVGKAARTVRDFVNTHSEHGGADEPDSTGGTPGDTEDDDDLIEAPSEPIADQSSVGNDSTPDPTDEHPPHPDSDAGTDSEADEDPSQRLARSEVIDSTSLPEPESGEVVAEPTGEQPDMADLREELNEQFESIRIVEPGQYELNLMELYDREEYIIALQENGRYVIEVPDAWDTDDTHL